MLTSDDRLQARPGLGAGQAGCALLVNWAPYCMMSAVVMMSGNVTLAGAKPERAPGSAWAEKRDYLYQCDRERLLALIQDGGWLCKFESGNTAKGHSMIVIPSGFMIMTAAENATMLRWPLISDDADKQRVSSGLRNLLDSFPEFRVEAQGRAQARALHDVCGSAGGEGRPLALRSPQAAGAVAPSSPSGTKPVTEHRESRDQTASSSESSSK